MTARRSDGPDLSTRSGWPIAPIISPWRCRGVSASGWRSPGRWLNEPRLLLADEPTGNLDSAASFEVLRLLESLHTSGLTLVVVTHDPRLAANVDRLISMRDGAFIDETRPTGGTGEDAAGLMGFAS